MRIDFAIEGGLAAFPGLAKPVTIDCDALTATDRTRLHDLVRRSGFFALSAAPRATDVPDARCYTIAVDDGARRKRVTVSEPIESAPLRELVAELAGHARRVRRG